jgi:hypothetical protein
MKYELISSAEAIFAFFFFCDLLRRSIHYYLRPGFKTQVTTISIVGPYESYSVTRDERNLRAQSAILVERLKCTNICKGEAKIE